MRSDQTFGIDRPVRSIEPSPANRRYTWPMLTNRSAPQARVVPILMVANVRAAVTWCARVFGFVEHVRTSNGKHVQLGLPGGGELLIGEVRPRPSPPSDLLWTAIMIKVDDPTATRARAADNYATVLDEMIDDIFGHRWVVMRPGQLWANRGEPPAHVVPAVWVTNVRAAVDWYTRVFGFVGDVQAPDGAHAELDLPGGGAMVVGEVHPVAKVSSDRSPEILLKVDDAAATLACAVANGATVVFDVRDIEAGERQATIDDVFGHRWMLTQTLADVAPEQWGGRTITPRK